VTAEGDSRRIRLVVEYDGTDFAGWQRQPRSPTIQAALEDALLRLTGERLVVHGAGRTDAGVHALGQVAAITTASPLPAETLRRALCALLPPAISVVAADEVEASFDPRRHARGKLYRYRIWNRPSRSPHEARHAWHRTRPLDDAAMAEAAALLIGEHDFAAFRAADCERRTTVRRVFSLAVRRSGPLVTVEVEATAFLKNMVRIIVGTLDEVGRGRLSPDAVAAILAGRDRAAAGPTAPPHGLFLVEVHYDRPMAGPLAGPVVDSPPRR
jgi:tRNA pseudouridine38-40 synthase